MTSPFLNSSIVTQTSQGITTVSLCVIFPIISLQGEHETIIDTQSDHVGMAEGIAEIEGRTDGNKDGENVVEGSTEGIPDGIREGN